MSSQDVEDALRRDVEKAQGNLRRFLARKDPTAISERVRVGIGAVVTDDEGRFLLCERKPGRHGAGEWGFPGGKPDAAETPTLACLRELEEETGIKADFAQPLGIWTYDRFPDHDLHYVTLYFLVDHQGQEPQNLEPEKHGDWEWVSPEDAFERPLFAGVRQVMELFS